MDIRHSTEYGTLTNADCMDALCDLDDESIDLVILDPFIGSGTTAIACIKEKRHFIGFELDKTYFDIAQERIKTEQSQLTLF